MRAEDLPDHRRPNTWPVCLHRGCAVRVDPWDHNTRCPVHRPDVDAPIRWRPHVIVNVPTFKEH